MSSTHPIRAALIGAGRWGKNYLRSSLLLEDFNITHLTTGQADRLSEEFDLSDISIYSDWRSLPVGEIDCAIICTPPATHYEISAYFIKASIPILVEKPVSFHLNEVSTLLRLAKYHKTSVICGYVDLANPALRSLLKTCPHSGEIISLEGNWSANGPHRFDCNALWDWGPHPFAVIHSLIEEEPKNMNASIIRTSGGELYNVRLEWNQIHANLLFGNGAVKKSRYLKIVSSRGTHIFDDCQTSKAMFNGCTVTHSHGSPLVSLISRLRDLCKCAKNDVQDLILSQRVTKSIARINGAIANHRA